MPSSQSHLHSVVRLQATLRRQQKHRLAQQKSLLVHPTDQGLNVLIQPYSKDQQVILKLKDFSKDITLLLRRQPSVENNIKSQLHRDPVQTVCIVEPRRAVTEQTELYNASTQVLIPKKQKSETSDRLKQKSSVIQRNDNIRLTQSKQNRREYQPVEYPVQDYPIRPMLISVPVVMNRFTREMEPSTENIVHDFPSKLTASKIQSLIESLNLRKQRNNIKHAPMADKRRSCPDQLSGLIKATPYCRERWRIVESLASKSFSSSREQLLPELRKAPTKHEMDNDQEETFEALMHSKYHKNMTAGVGRNRVPSEERGSYARSSRIKTVSLQQQSRLYAGKSYYVSQKYTPWEIQQSKE